MKFILAQKLTMSQEFVADGTVVPVTWVQAGPCQVVQIKTQDHEGYQAVQIGFGQRKKLNKAQQGHIKGLPQFRFLKEFRVDTVTPYQRGQVIDVSTFAVGDTVSVTGTSRGKGFQGVVKRHHFAGSPATHGHKDQLRMPGSIGSTGPQRVLKGTRMAGQMGNQRATVLHLEVVKIDKEKNQLALKGAVPGARGSLLLLATK